MTNNLLTTAAAAFNAGDYAKAIWLSTLTSTLEQTDEDAILSFRIIALSSIKLGDFTSAIDPIVRYCAYKYADGSELIIFSCRQMWESGRWDLAYRLLELAYRSCPVQDTVVLLYIKTLIMLGKNREAVTVFEETSSNSPTIEAVYKNAIKDINNKIIDDDGEYSLENIQSGAWIGYPTLVCTSWPEQVISSRTSGSFLKDIGWILDKILSGSYKRCLSLGSRVGFVELPVFMKNNLEEVAFFGISSKQEEIINESINTLGLNIKTIFMNTLNILNCRDYGDFESVIICNLDSGLDEIFRFIINDTYIKAVIVGISSHSKQVCDFAKYFNSRTDTNIYNILVGLSSCVIIKYPS